MCGMLLFAEQYVSMLACMIMCLGVSVCVCVCVCAFVCGRPGGLKDIGGKDVA